MSAWESICGDRTTNKKVMARVALVIGTGEYEKGFKPLTAALRDVEAIANILRDPEMGDFDQVDTLVDQARDRIAETIETWFRERQKDDLAVLYLSGHGVKDRQLDLYFAARNTRKEKEELVKSTAIPASFVRDCIRESKAKRQVIILDCCFSGAFGDLLAKDDGSIQVEALMPADDLGVEGRVVLTSSSSIQYSFEQREGGLSVYTRYLVEGIRTGAADTDSDGAISVQELHQYASRKVQEESPAMTPKIIVLKDEGYQIRIAKAPLGDPKVKYRKEVEAIVQEDGDTIDELSRRVLKAWQNRLGLSAEEATAIETEILEPIRQRQAKLREYREALSLALQISNPLGTRERKRLKQLQKVLGLLDENVHPIEAELLGEDDEPPLESLAELLAEALAEAEDDESSLESLFDEPELVEQPDESLLLEPPVILPPPGISLESEKGVDYTCLRDLLEASKWKDADKETARRMLEAMEKSRWSEVRGDDLLNFPCKDLKTIDRLWVHHSGGKWGLSVQTRIWEECGKPMDYNADWEKFGDRVGWRKDGNWQDYDQLTFDFSISPAGEFPAGGWGVGGLGGWFVFLFSRTETCKL